MAKYEVQMIARSQSTIVVEAESEHVAKMKATHLALVNGTKMPIRFCLIPWDATRIETPPKK